MTGPKLKERKVKVSAGAKITRATPAGAGLGNIRDSIDAIDARIHALLNERARFAQLVGISKSASGKAVDYYRPEREAEVLRMALKRNQGPLRDEEIARLFREIMSACLAQQEPLKVAFLGPERSEEHTSELQSPDHLVCRLLLEKKNTILLTR